MTVVILCVPRQLRPDDYFPIEEAWACWVRQVQYLAKYVLK